MPSSWSRRRVGAKRMYEVLDPERNLEFRVVMKPHYEVRGFERFEVRM
ncbi:MAG: hypothetical protein QXU75_07530 [Candidatus Methanomethylicaceae archaeon]